MPDMKYKKFTTGFVTQTFDVNGKCLSQEFTAGDNIEYEIVGDDNIYSSLIANLDYQPFHMKQPECVNNTQPQSDQQKKES